jgi:membrane protease YdiL (CAAX protease family)
MHLLPGFNNPIALSNVVLTADAEAYTLYLNFDKTLAGLLLLGVCYPGWSNRGGLQGAMTSRVVGLIGAIVLGSICMSYVLGYVRFEPKWTSLFWLWAAVNLLSTCLSEEAFFRGFVQRELQSALRFVRHGHVIALLISATLFGMAHFAGGWRYVLLATLAGAGYGYVYQRTQRIEWAMLTHFALNTTHFLLFTYPRLAL